MAPCGDCSTVQWPHGETAVLLSTSCVQTTALSTYEWCQQLLSLHYIVLHATHHYTTLYCMLHMALLSLHYIVVHATHGSTITTLHCSACYTWLYYHYTTLFCMLHMALLLLQYTVLHTADCPTITAVHCTAGVTMMARQYCTACYTILHGTQHNTVLQCTHGKCAVTV